MPAFLMSALFSAFVATLIVNVTWREWGPYRYAKYKFFKVALRARAGWFILALAILLLLVSIGGGLHAPSTAMYTWADFVASARFASAVLGFFFGFLLVFWLTRIASIEARNITWQHQFEGVLLLLLLVIGSIADQIGPMLRNITEFNAGAQGVSVKLGLGAPSAAPKSVQSDAAIVVTSRTKGDTADALYFISSMEEIVERDIRYVRFMADADNTKFVPSNKSLINIRPYFRSTVGALSACLHAVAIDTGDDEWANGYYKRIRKTLDVLIVLRPKVPEDEIERVATSFHDIIDDLTSDLLSTVLKRKGERLKPIYDGCHAMFEVNCPLHEPDIHDSDSRKTDASAEESSGAPIEKSLSYLRTCVGRKKGQVTGLTKRMASLAADRLEKSEFHATPYLSLVYASLLWRTDLNDVAAREAEEMLARLKEQLNGAQAGHSHQIKWYIFRVRNWLTVMFEQWLDSSGSGSPALLLYHVSNLDSAIIELEAIEGVRQAWSRFGGKEPAKSVASLDDSVLTRGTMDGCPSSSSYAGRNIEAPLAVVYLRQLLLYLHRKNQAIAIDNADASNKLNTRLRHVLGLNLSCFNLIFGADKSDQMKGEIAEVVAEIVLSSAASTDKIGDRTVTRRYLAMAREAAGIGMEAIERFAKKQDNDASSSIVHASRRQSQFERYAHLKAMHESAKRDLQR